MDAKNRKMENLKIAFDVIEDRVKILVGHNKVSSNLAFDTRITIELKLRWVKDGHMTPEKELSFFSGFVSRESTCTTLTHSTLRNLPACVCNVHDTFLQEPCSEKYYVVCGQNFIVCALCDRKASGDNH